MPPSEYYSHLGPFRDLFLTGCPMLTYHHVGPRPRRARIKGLYLSPKLFTRQLSELQAAGFATARYDAETVQSKNGQRLIFLTFDDGFCDVFEHALPVMQQHRFCGIQFLVSELLGKTNEWQQRAGDVVEPLMDVAQ